MVEVIMMKLVLLGKPQMVDILLRENKLFWLDDFYIIKLDGNDDIIWEKTYGGSGYDIAFHPANN